MEHVIVERVFAQPVTRDDFDRSVEDSKACFTARGVRHVRSCLSRDGLRMLCEFTAPDAETVRQANLLAGKPFERVWTAEVIEP